MFIYFEVVYKLQAASYKPNSPTPNSPTPDKTQNFPSSSSCDCDCDVTTLRTNYIIVFQYEDPLISSCWQTRIYFVEWMRICFFVLFVLLFFSSWLPDCTKIEPFILIEPCTLISHSLRSQVCVRFESHNVIDPLLHNEILMAALKN